MNAREYMKRRCVCGRLREEHAHVKQPFEGRLLLRVLPLTAGPPCAGFLDEFELELQGNPEENVHLAPLVEEAVEEELAAERLRRGDSLS